MHGRQGRSAGNQSNRLRPRPACLANGLPACIVGSAVSVGKLPWRLHRYVYGLEGQIGKKRFAAPAVLLEIIDHAVDEKFRGIEVVRQTDRFAILEPGRLAIEGNVGSLLPVVGTGGIENERSIESVVVGKLSRSMSEVPFTGHQCPITPRSQVIRQ